MIKKLKGLPFLVGVIVLVSVGVTLVFVRIEKWKRRIAYEKWLAVLLFLNIRCKLNKAFEIRFRKFQPILEKNSKTALVFLEAV